MTRQESIQKFEAMLTPVMEKFVEGLSQDEKLDVYYENMGLVGEDLYRMMAKAAMAVWEASAEAQEFAEAQSK